MLRRALFFGLTLALIAVVIGLMVRSGRQEKEPASQIMEKIEESVPSATRVLDPRDLKAVLRQIAWEEKKDSAKPSYAARHEIEIRNSGNTPYKEMGLQFVYASRGGKGRATRTCSIAQTIAPGARVKLADVRTDGFSEPARDPGIRVVYADIGTASPPKQ
jgi:hypothetical protein